MRRCRGPKSANSLCSCVAYAPRRSCCGGAEVATTSTNSLRVSSLRKAYRRTKDGTTVPLWRTDSEKLGKFQYAMLTNKQYAAVLVVDIG